MLLPDDQTYDITFYICQFQHNLLVGPFFVKRRKLICTPSKKQNNGLKQQDTDLLSDCYLPILNRLSFS